MSGKKYAGCFGLVLLLCVAGACGGQETDQAQYPIMPPGFTVEQPYDNLLVGQMEDLTAKGPIDRIDPSVKRPDKSLVRPVQRPPKGCSELNPDACPPSSAVTPPDERDLVRCGENWVDTFDDPEHCGACFVACATSDCVDGACVNGH